MAKQKAIEMLLYESIHPGFLGDLLLQTAEAIVKENHYPDWIFTDNALESNSE